jgi:predicted nuclease of predicted toxin-antitoxin system
VTLWLDAHLSPALAPWLAATCGVSCAAVRDLGLRDAPDRHIFMAGRAAHAVIVTKASAFSASSF